MAVGCVRFEIGADLSTPQHVQWLQVTQTTDSFGDRITNSANFPVGGTFQCRIQPADNDILDLFSKRGALQHYIVYILDDVQFTYDDLLVDTSDSRKFAVRDWRSRQDIQNAMVILCEIQP